MQKFLLALSLFFAITLVGCSAPTGAPSSASPGPTTTAIPTATLVPLQPTATATAMNTSVPAATNTVVPVVSTATSPPAAATNTPQPATATAKAEPVALTGTGKRVAGPVDLKAGLARFAMKHTGKSSFIVKLLDSEGKPAGGVAGVDSLLANQNGDWDGEKAVRIEKDGSYILDVTADGNWSITISQ